MCLLLLGSVDFLSKPSPCLKPTHSGVKTIADALLCIDKGCKPRSLMYMQFVLQETDPGRHGLVHDHGRPFTSINSLRPAVLKVCQHSKPAPYQP